MKFISSIHLASLLFGCLLLSSCREEGQDPVFTPDEKDDIEFDLVFDSRATDPSLLEEYKDYFEDGKSCVLISQRTGNMSLDFEEDSNNCYRYIYYKNDAADWDSGYNFRSENPLGWQQILDNGLFNNGFAFGALFFPQNYRLDNEVETDQSKETTFIESDILGAWHRTSVIRDRLKFQLHHLMCKLHINLYIPVLDSKNGNGYNPSKVVASAISFRTDFSIEWGDRTTELPPIAKPSASETGRVNDIIMLKRVDGEETTLNTDFLGNFNVDTSTFPSDNVRKYSFEVLFPEQSVSGDFLRFTVTVANVDYNFLFNSAYLTQNATGFAFKSGEITNLELYLPRTDNEVVLINANVKKWGEARAQFTITPATPDTSNSNP